jgi:hypothetical protein
MPGLSTKDGSGGGRRRLFYRGRNEFRRISAIPKFILILPSPVPETLYRQKPYRGNLRWENIGIYLPLVLARCRPYNPRE